MTEGKVAFDPTDEVRPERQLLLLWLRRVFWWFCFLSELSFRSICQGVSLASFMKSQALLVFRLRVQVIERFVVAASRLRGAVFSDTRFAKARSEGWVLAAAGPPTAAEADATPWDGEPPKQYGDLLAREPPVSRTTQRRCHNAGTLLLATIDD